MIKKSVFSSLVSILLVLTFLSTPAPAKAAGWCECVGYVKNYFGITEPTGNAPAMGTWFLAHGFVRITNPEPGAVAVMQAGFPGTPAGHVGIINSVTYGGDYVTLNLKGARQSTGSTEFTEFDCTNVRNTSWPKFLKSRTGIAYYKLPRYSIRSAVARSGYSSLYFDINGGATGTGAYVIGWNYHGGNNQLYNLVRYDTTYKIIARNSAMCLVPQTTGQGARLVQRKCVADSRYSNAEKWQLVNTSTGYMLKYVPSGLVVDLNNGSLSPGTSILVWSSHNGTNQRWWLERR
jgi:hypothetical protein